MNNAIIGADILAHCGLLDIKSLGLVDSMTSSVVSGNSISTTNSESSRRTIVLGRSILTLLEEFKISPEPIN